MGKTSKVKKADRLMSQEKRRMAVEARKAGLTYQAIAERVGYGSVSSAFTAVQKGLEATYEEPVRDFRTLQMERLRHMLVVLWPKINAGDERTIATALAVMDKMDRLQGAEQQTTEIKHSGAVLVAQGDKEEFIAAMKRMAGIDAEGRNLHAEQIHNPEVGELTAGQYPPGMGSAGGEHADIVDAEVVEVTEQAQGGDLGAGDQPSRDEIGAEDVHPSRKTYAFGVDPKGVHTNGNGKAHGRTDP